MRPPHHIEEMDLLAQTLGYFNISSTYSCLLKRISDVNPFGSAALLDRKELLEKRKKLIGSVSQSR